jgi:hypothetical protein
MAAVVLAATLVGGCGGEAARELEATLAQRLPAVVDGFYLTAVGRHDHDLHVRVTCADGFADVTSLHTEEDDRMTLADDGRTLEIDLRLRPRPGASSRHDLDGVRFRARGDAPVTLAEGTLDGVVLARAPAPLDDRMRPDEPPTLPEEAEVVRYPLLPRRFDETDFGVAFQLVRPSTPAAATLGPDAVDRLRALGYVEERHASVQRRALPMAGRTAMFARRA